jgi:hypothetical protein
MARQAKAIQDHEQEEKDYQKDLLRYEANVAEWKRKKPQERGQVPDRPERPVCPRYLCSDITIEALGQRLLEAPRGLLLYRDELSGWLRSFDCYRHGRGGDVAHWLSLHAARGMLVDRKGGDHRTLYVPRGYAAITGGIQPSILARVLEREHFEDGLAARLLFAMPPRKQKVWTEYDLETEQLSALAQLYTDLYGLNLKLNEQSEFLEPVPVKLSREAKGLWVAFYNEHAVEQAKLTGDLAAAWSKLEGYAARLALVFHCCRTVCKQDVDPAFIDKQSMASGIALSQWFCNETRRVYAALSTTEEDRDLDELIQLIEQRGGTITVRQLMRASSKYRAGADVAEQALGNLVKRGFAVTEMKQPGEEGGRPTCVWRLV